MSKVSIIVPVYNVKQYLPKCIESIQSQTERDIEIILVDDGSTDESGAICDCYAKEDSRISVIHQENGGLGAARNTGISAATAEYLLFIDSDDYVTADLVEKTYSAAVANAADMVVFGYQRVFENGEVDYAYDPPASAAEKSACALSENPELLLVAPSACNKLFKKSLFKDIQFPPRAWYEDLQTIPKLYPKANKIVCLHNYYPYKYFLRDNSIMHNGDAEKTVTRRIEAVDVIFDYFRADDALFTQYAEELKWLYMYHGYFLPAREIMNFKGNTKPYLTVLYTNLMQKFLMCEIQNNRYYAQLSNREKLIFRLLLSNQYYVIKGFVLLNRLLKK